MPIRLAISERLNCNEHLIRIFNQTVQSQSVTLRTSCRPVTGQHTADTYQAFAPSLRHPYKTDEPIDIMRFQPSLLAFSDGAYSRPRHHIYVCTASVLDSFRESDSCPAVNNSCLSTTFHCACDLDVFRIGHAYLPRLQLAHNTLNSHRPRLPAAPSACTSRTRRIDLPP